MPTTTEHARGPRCPSRHPLQHRPHTFENGGVTTESGLRGALAAQNDCQLLFFPLKTLLTSTHNSTSGYTSTVTYGTKGALSPFLSKSLLPGQFPTPRTLLPHARLLRDSGVRLQEVQDTRNFLNHRGCERLCVSPSCSLLTSPLSQVSTAASHPPPHLRTEGSTAMVTWSAGTTAHWRARQHPLARDFR